MVVDLDKERDEIKRTLVVANQTVAGKSLLDAPAQGEQEPRRFIVICPQSGEDRPGGPDGAHERLAHTLEELEAAGFEAIGQVVHPTRIRRSRTRCSSTRPTTW